MEMEYYLIQAKITTTLHDVHKQDSKMPSGTRNDDHLQNKNAIRYSTLCLLFNGKITGTLTIQPAQMDTGLVTG